ncbi:DUF2087 domain-containing protein [Streptomyces flavalbus]|uniref:DUF2087 domain-containing protein n=1 Tax=Streptomyces flavalbus TaxID=2665155 RepID=A0ABW2W3N9_9ACTN
MTADDLAGLFADEKRVRAFAAVALGATTPAAVASRAELSAKDAAVALLRLQERQVVTRDGAGLTVAYRYLRQRAREGAASAPGEEFGSGDAQVDAVLRTFVRDGRLVGLPAQWTRKKLVLRYVAERAFEPGVDYPEAAVNDRLRAWCEGGTLDHVTLRRYLVDLHHLHRREGVYWRPAE